MILISAREFSSDSILLHCSRLATQRLDCILHEAQQLLHIDSTGKESFFPSSGGGGGFVTT